MTVIGRFGVPKIFTFKMRLSVKPFLCVCVKMSFICVRRKNHFHINGFRGLGNLEMAYYSLSLRFAHYDKSLGFFNYFSKKTGANNQALFFLFSFDSNSFHVFLQLRGFMNEVLLDQIPSLIDLQRYLEQLSIMEPPAIKKDIILEQVNAL